MSRILHWIAYAVIHPDWRRYPVFRVRLPEMAAGLSSFRKFIPADLVQMLLRRGIEARPGGSISGPHGDVHRRCRLSPGFLNGSGDRVIPILSKYLDITSEAIVANDGTIDKFIGDAVMAFWGRADRASEPRFALLPCSTCLRCRDRDVWTIGRSGSSPSSIRIWHQLWPHAGRQHRFRVALELHGHR